MDQLDRYDPDDFDFLGPPFSAPVGRDLLLTIPQEDAVSAALNALGRGTALVLVTGESGSGRTLVAEVLADALRGRNLVVDEIAQLGGLGGTALLRRLAPLLRTAPEWLAPMLAAVASEASAAVPDAAKPDVHAPGLATPRHHRAAPQYAAKGARPPAASEMEPSGPYASRLDASGPAVLHETAQASARLVGSAQAEAPLAVIVDDAGTWPIGSLLLLASLACLPARDGPLLQVVLIGDAGLERRLVPLHRAGSAGGSTAPVSLRIPPLTIRQGQEYLAHRFAAAGGRLERTMSAAAVGEILVRCGGNPGRIDRLTDDCLALTARRRRRIVTPAVVRAVRQPSARRSARLSGPTIYALLGASGGVLAAGAGLGLAVHAWTLDRPTLFGSLPTRRTTALSSLAVSANPDAALLLEASRFGALSPADTASATHGAADRPVAAPVLVPTVPPSAVPPSSIPSAPSPALPVRSAPAPAASPPAPAPLPAWPVTPRVASNLTTVTAQPLLLDPVPPPPILAAPDALPPVVLPLPAPAVPTVVQTGDSAGLPDSASPVLSPPAVWPVPSRIVEAPADAAPRAVVDAPQAGVPQAGAPTPRGVALPFDAPLASSPPTLPSVTVHAPQVAVPHYAESVVMHVARGRDTTSVLLRRIWGQDDATAEALFRSLNPTIDGQGPWPAGTIVTVPHRTRREAALPARPRVEQARLPVSPVPQPHVIQDNPAGQVQSALPYFCRSILPHNGAEDAYTRQVCGH